MAVTRLVEMVPVDLGALRFRTPGGEKPKMVFDGDVLLAATGYGFWKDGDITLKHPPMFAVRALVTEGAKHADPRRTLKIVGTGNRNFTRVLDAETGEDLSLQLGIFRIDYGIGPNKDHEATLTVALSCPVIFDIGPSMDKFFSAE